MPLSCLNALLFMTIRPFQFTIWLPLMAAFFFASCGQYQKLLRSDDIELKFQKAIEYYEDGNYGRTITLLNDVIPAFRGTARAERVNYYFAMAHYKQRDYIMASHYFRSFYSAFPHSEHAEEFLFLSAYCKYLESPRSSLDQTTTREAIRELQGFINRYPQSERVEEANELIDELRHKLEKKRFDNAMLYYELNDYPAAVTTFRNLISDFPDTQYHERALYYIVRSHYEHASRSIPMRQQERYEQVLAAFNQLIRVFPESEYLSAAERMKTSASQSIERLSNHQEP